jgi:hypothetical protein
MDKCIEEGQHMTNPYNPFEDKTLHITEKRDQSTVTEDRTPFNDVIKHVDIVQGFQTPKQLDQFPRWYQNPRRIYSTISVLIFAVIMGYQIFRIIVTIASGK